MYQNKKKNKSRKITTLNGLIGKFALENFDAFFNTFKGKNNLADEALLALNHFITTLNGFFDLIDNLNEEITTNNTNIYWYSYTNLAASGHSSDYIRAVSNYFNEAEFSNVSINMNAEEAEDYNTDNGTCFGKVLFILSFDTFNTYLTKIKCIFF